MSRKRKTVIKILKNGRKQKEAERGIKRNRRRRRRKRRRRGRKGSLKRRAELQSFGCKMTD